MRKITAKALLYPRSQQRQSGGGDCSEYRQAYSQCRRYGVCFLLLVSLTASAVITAVGVYLEHLLPGGNVLAWTIHLMLDIGVVTLLFAMIFKFLPDARLSCRDVRLGAALTTALFLVGKYALGLYLGSGAPGSAYGAAGSLVAMLIWREVSLTSNEVQHMTASHLAIPRTLPNINWRLERRLH